MTYIHTRIHRLLQHTAFHLRSIAVPIKQQLPFFLIYLLWTSKAPLFSFFYDVTHGYGGSMLEPLNAFAFNACKAYLICALLCAFRPRWIKVVAYAVFFTFVLVYLFLGSTFHMDISPTVLTLLAETNARESADFVNAYLLSASTLRIVAEWACFIAVTVVIEKFYPRLRQCIGRGMQTAIGVLLLPIFVCGCIDSKAYITLFHTHNTSELSQWDIDYADLTSDSLSRLIMSAVGIHLKGVEMQDAVRFTLQMKRDASLLEPNDSLCVVFVIGESYIKYHSSLYGYPLPTAPRMESERRRGNLIAFNNVCAPYNNTTSVIRNLLNCNSIGHGERWNESPYFPAVMHQAGYDVLLWDNQREMGSKEVFTFALNSYLYHPEIRKVYAQENADCYDYDGALLDDFFAHASKPRKHSFVMLHLVGQHVLAGERFPHTHENEVFHPSDVPNHAPYLDDTRRQFIADYDNATRYNDRLMGRLFDYYRGRNAVIIYVSDHGEEIYDYQDQMGRIKGELTPNRVKYQYDVPLVVWTSDSYRKAHPTLMHELASATNRPLMTDNICHLIFRLSGVRSSYYRADRDISSPAFRPSRRIIDDNFDYDRLRWQLTHNLK